MILRILRLNLLFWSFITKYQPKEKSRLGGKGICSMLFFVIVFEICWAHMLRKSYSVFKKKADGQADNFLNLEKFQCCDKPGSLFTPSPYVAWDRMGCSWQPAWGPKSGGVSVRPANWVTRPTEKIPRCVNFGRTMRATRICLKQCEGYAGLSGISRPRGPVTNVWPQAANFTQPNTFAVVVIWSWRNISFFRSLF